LNSLLPEQGENRLVETSSTPLITSYKAIKHGLIGRASRFAYVKVHSPRTKAMDISQQEAFPRELAPYRPGLPAFS